MVNKREIFKFSGPCHLTTVDWSDPDHRRCIAASLVQGVFVQERDRQERRQGPEAQAEMWWSFFNFNLLQPLHDSVDGSIFGAVYKWSKKAAGVRSRPPGAPKIVVAFRGTVKRAVTLARDIRLDLHILKNRLHTTSRFHEAFDAVKTNVHRHGVDNVWIVGHSLGAAIAMLAGKKMAEEEGQFLQAHLFNPPFVSGPVERIKNEKLKRGFHLTSSLVKAVLGKRTRIESECTFSALQPWVPCLYLNPRDDLCSGYVGYFGNLKAMQHMRACRTAKLAVQHSIAVMVFSLFGKKSKAGHLIPSARLTVSLSPAPDFRRAHGIYQWWAPDIRIDCSEHRLDTAETPLEGQTNPAFVRGLRFNMAT